MKLFTKTLIATTLVATATIANALPEKLSTSMQYRNFLVTPDNALLVVGDCARAAVCGSQALDGRSDIYNFVSTGITDANYVAAGAYNTAYITTDGTLKITKITNVSTDAPWMTPAIPGTVFDVAIKGIDVYALTDYNGDKLLYKVDRYGTVTKVSEKTDWVQLAAGYYAAGAIDSAGDVYMWGSKAVMMGNDAATGNAEVTPAPTVAGLNIKKLTIGNYAVTALASDNTVWTWGENGFYRRLGDGTTANRGVPGRVLGIDKVKDAVQWFGGSYFILEDDRLASTGWDNLMSYAGQAEAKITGTDLTVYFGDTAMTVPVKSKYISQGSGQTFFMIGTDDKVYGGGANRFGELNIGGNDPVEVHKLIEIPGLQVVTSTPVEEATRTLADSTSTKGNASYNNGKGGNYEWTGHSDNGKGQARNKVFATGADGRGFSRSK